MADSTAPSPTPPRRRWLRRLLLVAVVLVLGLTLLVAVAPTLLSTRPAVGLILKQVNHRLNGHVEVASLSLGWLSGTKLDGVRVFDAANVQVAQADHVACPMPLWRAVTGRYPLGDTVVDGLAFDARYDAQGRLNFAQLVKSTPSTNATPAPSKPAADDKLSKLPDVSGNVQVKNARGTVSQPGKPTVYLTGLAAAVNIPNINRPITDHVDASVRVGDAGPIGHLVADGTAAAIKGNLVALETAAIHQTGDGTDLDLAALKPFLPATLGVDTLAGLLDGHLALDVPDGRSATLTASLAAKQKVQFGGAVLKGDTFSTDTFAVAVPKVSAAFPNGLGDWQAGRITTGTDPISFKIDPGQLTLALDVVPQAVLNLAGGKPPASAGRVDFADHFDVGRIFAQLPHAAHLQDGVAVTRGTLEQSVKLALVPDRGTAAVGTHLTDVAATHTVDGKPQPVTLQPVDLTASMADVGGTSPVDGLRDLSLKLTSKFANADVHGATFAGVSGTLTAQLQALQAEAGQLVDFGGVQLAGDLAVGLANAGQSAIKVDATLNGFRYAGPTPKPTTQPAAEPPLPPMVVTAGSLAAHGTVTQGSTDVTLDLPTLSATGVNLTRGTAAYAFKPVAAAVAATVGTAEPRGLKLTRLTADVGGLATVAMTTPITVADLSHAATTAVGGVKVDGELADLTALAAAAGAKPADAYPYRGHYTLVEDLTGGTAVALKGGVTVAKFQVMQGQTVQFAEDQLVVANDVAMTPDLNAATLHAVSVAMQSSGALNVSIAGGTVTDLAHARNLHLPVQLKYDLAKLWPVIHPMLIEPGKPDGYADVKLSGAFTKQWLVGGSYPADQPMATAIKPLQVDADLAVADFEHSGLAVKDLDVPVTVRNGLLVTSYPDGHAAPVATANDGQLDLSALTVDLTQTPYRLTTPAAKVVLTHATINPLFSQSYLAKVVNNPIFATAQQATGLIDFTVDSCQQLPLGDLLTQAVPANTGAANVRFSLTNLHIGLQGLGAVSSALKADSFEANIKDGTVAVAKGISTQHVKFVTGSYTIAFDGDVRLADEAFVPMTVTVPLAKLVEQAGIHDPNSLKFVPDAARVPVKGTVHNPDYSALLGVVANAAKDAAVKGGLGNLLGGGKGKGGDAKQNPADAIGGFINGFGKKRK